MLREGLKSVGREEGIVCLTRHQETAHQLVELLLVDFLLRALSDDTAGTDIIKVVQPLGRVALHLSQTHRPQGSN